MNPGARRVDTRVGQSSSSVDPAVEWVPDSLEGREGKGSEEGVSILPKSAISSTTLPRHREVTQSPLFICLHEFKNSVYFKPTKEIRAFGVLTDTEATSNIEVVEHNSIPSLRWKSGCPMTSHAGECQRLKKRLTAM